MQISSAFKIVRRELSIIQLWNAFFFENAVLALSSYPLIPRNPLIGEGQFHRDAKLITHRRRHACVLYCTIPSRSYHWPLHSSIRWDGSLALCWVGHVFIRDVKAYRDSKNCRPFPVDYSSKPQSSTRSYASFGPNVLGPLFRRGRVFNVGGPPSLKRHGGDRWPSHSLATCSRIAPAASESHVRHRFVRLSRSLRTGWPMYRNALHKHLL
jgi:hypothetical protein